MESMKFWGRVFLIVFSVVFFLPAISFGADTKNGASLYIAPASGSFTVGNTFSISFYLNTADHFINAVDAEILFPPDKLQVVSPSAASSFIQVWMVAPTFSNAQGSLHFQGVVPAPGINTDAGLISTVTFRVKSAGTVLIKFSDKSRVLLNDGRGTDILNKTTNGIYTLTLPPPEGPIVVSPTHPDQERWYNSNNISFNWGGNNEAVGEVSYILNRNPTDVPDDISEGTRRSVSFKNVPDSVYYFHIKTLRDGVWGGATHYAVKIDATPPAQFPIEVSPSRRTSDTKPILSFITTDNLSGVDHYEIKIISLTNAQNSILKPNVNGGDQTFFIETSSPYMPELALGNYDVIVRVTDHAGNITDSTLRLEMVNSIFQFVNSEGLLVQGGVITISWATLWMIIGVLLVLFGWIAWKVWRSHHHAHFKLNSNILDDPIIKDRMAQLKAKQKEYAKAILILLIAGSFIMWGRFANAQSDSPIAPPLVNVFSKDVSDEELFYIGGKTEAPRSDVIVYLQNPQSGEVLSETVTADKVGNWFYSHPTFLAAGKYLLWMQAKIGNDLSPPSPQFQLTVSRTSLHLGASRFSAEVVYLVISLVLLLILLGVVAFIFYHFRAGHKKRRLLLQKIKEAEESIRRGFAIVRRDIESELAVIHRLRLKGTFAEEEKKRERKLLEDLESVKKHIGEEVWEMERFERAE
ncbi:MAG: cohesin domain-containing protein [Patescibacteria group bacterium]